MLVISSFLCEAHLIEFLFAHGGGIVVEVLFSFSRI
jgi:hypothetical protein